MRYRQIDLTGTPEGATVLPERRQLVARSGTSASHLKNVSADESQLYYEDHVTTQRTQRKESPNLLRRENASSHSEAILQLPF